MNPQRSFYETFWSRIRRIVKNKSGQVTVLFALTLPVMFGVGALSVDGGYLFVAKTALQGAVDAAALAGASGLSVDTDTARARAMQFAQANMVLNNPVPASALNVDFGTLDLGTGQFTVSGTNVNGIRVRAQMNMPLILAGAIGFNTAQVTAQAVSAVRTSTCGGLFGAQKLVMSDGAEADSYDSDNGPYFGMTAGSNGSVCSNGDIDLNSGATVNGNASPGPDNSVQLSGGASVSGSIDPASTDFPMPTVDTSGAAASNDNNTVGQTSQGKNPIKASDRNFTLNSGDTITLNSGTYYLNNVDVKDGAKVYINPSSGPVIIYVTGNVSVSDGSKFVNQSEVPSKFQILSTGGHLDFFSTEFHGVIIGPNAKFVGKDASSFYGAVMANEVDMAGDSALHYDKALESTNLLPATTSQPFLGA